MQSQLSQILRQLKRKAIEKYNTALELLDSYDHQTMSRPKGNDATCVLSYEECRTVIEDHTLVALTILIAESGPEEKEMMISVVMNCMMA